MLRLIKLAVYAGAAYALYEVVQGMLSEPGLGPATGSRSRSRRELNRALDSGGGRMEALSDRSGFGQHEQTLDASGESVPHQVGRGVVMR